MSANFILHCAACRVIVRATTDDDPTVTGNEIAVEFESEYDLGDGKWKLLEDGVRTEPSPEDMQCASEGFF